MLVSGTMMLLRGMGLNVVYCGLSECLIVAWVLMIGHFGIGLRFVLKLPVYIGFRVLKANDYTSRAWLLLTAR